MTETLGQFGHPIEIRSPGIDVYLKQFTLTDVDDIFALIDRNREHLSQFHDDTAKKYKTREDVEKSITRPKVKNRLRFGIRDLSGRLVGSINLTPNETNPEKAEVGYYLGSEFTYKATGKKYIADAVKLLVHFAFRHLKYEELYAEVHKDNHASEKVLLRSGFSKKEDRGDHVIFNLKGEPS